jgi:NADH-dependent peroxiredoxin subunit F
MYDVIIVGAGPAGITAAIYAGRKKLKTLVLSRNIGGQAVWSSEIENYTGFQFISGQDLAKKFEEHLHQFDVELRQNAEVCCVNKVGDVFRVKVAQEIYNSRCVIVATGRQPKVLNVPGEAEYKNRGVTYCATCDAPLFADKDVAVIGGGNSALDAAIQLLDIANRIYMIDISDHIIGDPVMLDKVRSSAKVEFIPKTEVREILGSRFVDGIRILVGKKEERVIPVGGVFIEIGSCPAKEPTCKAKLNEHGEVMVNDRCETSVEGLFAAGDVTSVPEKQIIVAAGQGCIASLAAFKYISRRKFSEVENMVNERGEVYKCGICGNMVEVLAVGDGTLVCCGQDMDLLKAKSDEQGQEKHVPVIEKTENGFRVKVGSVAHPMEEKHFIQWIELIADGKSYKEFLKPLMKPEAEFCVKAATVSAREYCNLHGLWKTK